MKMKKQDAPRRTLRSPFRTTSAEHEYIARSAYQYGPPRPDWTAPISHNDWICMMLFTSGWEKRLEKLRSIQRANGAEDSKFLHRSEKRKLGLKAKPGRTAWHLELTAA